MSEVLERHVDRREFLRTVLIMLVGGILAYVGLKRFTPAFGQVVTGSYTIYQANGTIYAKNDVSITNDFQGNDATTVILQAMNALEPSGGRVNISTGVFIINSKITIPNNVSFVGMGKQKTVLQLKNNYSDPDMFLIAGVSYVEIREMSLNGNYQNSSGHARGIDCYGINNCLFENLELYNFTDLSIGLNSSINCVVSKCNIHDSGTFQPHGIALYNGSQYCKIDDCHIEKTGAGGMGVVVINSGNPCMDCIISKVTTYKTGLEGFNVDIGQIRIKIIDCTASFAGDNGITILGNECSVEGATHSFNNNNHGIYIADTDKTLIQGAQVKNNNQSHGAFSGIAVYTLVNKKNTNFTITGCISFDDQSVKTQQYGCYIQAIANNFYIVTDNNFLNNALGTLADLSTGPPNKQVANNLI